MELQVGDTVRNIGRTSRFYKQTGIVVRLERGWSVHVKYEGTKVLGRHPRRILRKTEPVPPVDILPEELFTL